jgi:hypothetical protein
MSGPAVSSYPSKKTEASFTFGPTPKTPKEPFTFGSTPKTPKEPFTFGSTPKTPKEPFTFGSTLKTSKPQKSSLLGASLRNTSQSRKDETKKRKRDESSSQPDFVAMNHNMETIKERISILEKQNRDMYLKILNSANNTIDLIQTLRNELQSLKSKE